MISAIVFKTILEFLEYKYYFIIIMCKNTKENQNSRIINFLINKPVLYHGKGFNIVGFGVFAALETAAIMFIIYFYLFIKGIDLHQISFWAMPLSFLCVWSGARIFHWIALGKEFFKDPIKYLMDTGFYMQGGVVGAIVWIFGMSFYGNIPFSIVCDSMAWGGLIGQFIGRLGCFNYGCCYGKETSSKIGVSYSNLESKILRWQPELKGISVHPSQLYMAGINLLTFIVFAFLINSNIQNGLISVIYLAWHGITRIGVEQFRSDIIFKEGRNWATFKLAVGLTFLSFLFWFFGASFDSSFKTVSLNVLNVSFENFFVLLKNHTIIIFPILISTIIAFIGYGIHGEKLGTFPALSSLGSTCNHPSDSTVIAKE